MTRLRFILVAIAVAGAVAIVLGRHTPAPKPSSPLPLSELLAAPVPKTVTLRILAKSNVAREAAVGKWSLVEAAALFRELNRLPPALKLASASPAEQTEEEFLCLQVIAYVAKSWTDWPRETAEAAVARLEAELQKESRRAGGVHLPDAAGLPTAHELLEQARARLTDAQRQVWLSENPGDLPGQ